jgi:hypothetical protein
MWKIARCGLLSAALLGSALASLAAQEVRGTLRDAATGQPLVSGTIELLTTDSSVVGRAVTDDEGFFALSAAEAGVYSVRAWRIDADTVTDGPLELGSGDVRDLDFLLLIEAIELNPLDVTVERGSEHLTEVGFYQRSSISNGVFMTRADIEEGISINTTDVLARVDGVQVNYRLSPGSPTVMLRAGVATERRLSASGLPDARCLPVIYMDGVTVQRGGGISSAETFDLESIPPERILALEIYRSPAETPAQFTSSAAACGVIVIWTR